MQHGFSEQFPEAGVLLLKRLEPLHFGDIHAAKLVKSGIEGRV